MIYITFIVKEIVSSLSTPIKTFDHSQKHCFINCFPIKPIELFKIKLMRIWFSSCEKEEL